MLQYNSHGLLNSRLERVIEGKCRDMCNQQHSSTQVQNGTTSVTQLCLSSTYVFVMDIHVDDRGSCPL